MAGGSGVMSPCSRHSLSLLHASYSLDAPIESPSPFVGMFDAIYRTNRMRLQVGADRGKEEEVFRPEERLTFPEALWMYTAGAAVAARCEHVLGACSSLGCINVTVDLLLL